MIAVSNDFKSAINQPSRYLDARILLNSNVMNYDIGTIEYNSSLGEDEKLIVGLALRSSIKIAVLDDEYKLINENFEGKEFDVQVGIKLPDDTYEFCSLGLFTVTKPVRERDKLNFEGKDRMYLLEKAYMTDLTFPATLMQIAQDIASKAGLTLKNAEFVNSDYIVLNKPILDNETLRTAIAAIAELAGGFARITRDGKLEIFNVSTPTSSTNLYAGSDVFVAVSESTIYDDLIVGEITMNQDNIVSVTNDDLMMATIEKIIVQTGEISVEEGIGDNTYKVVDNIWCQNPATAVQGLYNVLSGLMYLPFRANWQGNPAIDVGDAITVDTGLGYYTTIVGSRTLTFNGGLREEYEAKALGETGAKAEHVGNTIVQINKVKTEVRILDGKFEVKVSDDEGRFSGIELDIEDIELKVENSEGDITTLTTRANGVDAKINATTHSFTESGYWMKDSNGEMLLTPNGVANEQNFGRADNVEDGYPMKIPFHIGTQVSQIKQAILKWDISKFRTYSKGAASGGSSTSGGGGSSVNTVSVYDWTQGAGVSTDGRTITSATLGQPHSHYIDADKLAHRHRVILNDHYHSTPNHVHPPQFGILEAAVTSNWFAIYIDGVYRTSVDAQRGEIDLTTWITTNGWHTVELVVTSLKRLDINLFLKTYIRR